MEISDELVGAYREKTRNEDRTSCPSAEDLTALVAGGLPEARRGEIVDHLVSCSECALEVRLSREAQGFFLGQEAGDSVPGPAAEPAAATPSAVPVVVGSRRPARRRSVPTWFAVAASVVLAVGLAFLLTGEWRLASTDSADVQRAAGIDEISPATGMALTAAPELFSWPPQAGAEAYRLEILDAGARRVWLGEWQKEPALPWPATAPALGAGDYLWRVEVRGAVGRSELGPYAFSIR